MKILTDGIEIIQEGKRGFIPFLTLESIMMKTIYGKGKHILNFNNKKALWNELKRLEYIKDNEVVLYFPVFSMIFSSNVFEELHNLYIEKKTLTSTSPPSQMSNSSSCSSCNKTKTKSNSS